MTHVRIREIATYHPEHIVSKAEVIEHFKKQGRDISAFLESMGKSDRYVISNENENGLTMGIEASKKVLEKANLQGKDIDYIVFSSQVPEKLFPTNALYIHRAIQARTDTISIDTNANCAGMTVAVEQASRYMLANPHIQRALVVGSEQLSLVSNPEQEITYATYGDVACAVILEKTEEDAGFIDALYHVDTRNIDKILFPADGLSNLLNHNGKGRYVNFEWFDASFGTPITFNLIDSILEKNHLTISDIRAICISQFTFNDKVKIQKHYGLDDDTIIYIGDRFGYTGTSSPFIAMNEGINRGQIKRGDYVLFWTVGAGHQFIAMLFKY